MVASIHLPPQREQALSVGGDDEVTYLFQLEAKIQSITQRYTERLASNFDAGYEEFSKMAADFRDVLGLIWSVRTPSLQIQQLLSLQSTFLEYLPQFSSEFTEDDEEQTNALFGLLSMFDEAFSILVRTKEIKGTELVRLNSLVGSARSKVLIVLGEGEDEDEEFEDVDACEEATNSVSGQEVDADLGVKMKAAKILEHTICEIGKQQGMGID
ncbi:MAG: Ribosomal RNA-processing protein 7 [Vezdaea aestivalis]|nr:MAG: Ribosomal RNA-processing protein 7 [Vezdaea aestivalis]